MRLGSYGACGKPVERMKLRIENYGSGANEITEMLLIYRRKEMNGLYPLVLYTVYALLNRIRLGLGIFSCQGDGKGNKI